MDRKLVSIGLVAAGFMVAISGFMNVIANLNSVPPLFSSGMFLYAILALIVLGVALMMFGAISYLKAMSRPSP